MNEASVCGVLGENVFVACDHAVHVAISQQIIAFSRTLSVSNEFMSYQLAVDDEEQREVASGKRKRNETVLT